jgi:hypothetical protein
LNIDSASRTVTAVPAAEAIDASRPARFLAVDAPSSADDVPPVRGALCRGAQGQKLLVSGSVPLHGLRAADLPRESAGYRVGDRGYLDFERLYHLHEAGSFFVTRAKSNLKAERRYSHPVDRATGLICDQTVILSGFYSHKGFPVPLRRIKYIDPKTHKRLVFLTNQFGLPALSIADLYRCRWQVELFFKWIKQHLRIKAFFGTSENAVKTQIWIAISVYILVAIVKKRLNLPRSLYESLQILSLTLCEQMPLDELLVQIDSDQNPSDAHNQMNLFD